MQIFTITVLLTTLIVPFLFISKSEWQFLLFSEMWCAATFGRCRGNEEKSHKKEDHELLTESMIS